MKKAKTDEQIKKEFSRRISPLMRGPSMPKNNKLRGEVFGVKDATISRWCSGKDMPDMTKCCAMADYFNVSIDWLLLGREPRRELNSPTPTTLSSIYPELDGDMIEKVEALMQSLSTKKKARPR